MADPININSLFSDILPDPAAEMRQQQSDLLSVLGTVGGVAALNAPQQQQQLRYAAGGLFGVDTRTGSEKLREAMKGVDPNNPEDLIRLATMTDSIDPAKAVLIRQQAAQLTKQQRDEKEARERKSVEQQQADTIFALNTGSALETLTSDVTSREEREQAREGYASLIDTSTVLSTAEKDAQKELISQGAYDGKVDDVMRLADPKPITVGNRVLKRTVNGWEDIPASNVTVAQNGLRALAELRLTKGTPAYDAAIAAINEKSITNATQIEALAPPTVERGEISPTVQKFHGDAINSSMAASSLINEVDTLLNTIQSQNLLNYDTAGVAANVRTAARSAFGERDEIEILRTGYTKVRNTEIINSLPPGVASDRDIQIFAAGFPPDGASIAEINEYLRAAKSAAFKMKDATSLLSRELNRQVTKGIDANTLDYAIKYEQFEQDRDKLKTMMDSALSGRSNEEAQAYTNDVISDFNTEYGFVPAFIRGQ